MLSIVRQVWSIGTCAAKRLGSYTVTTVSILSLGEECVMHKLLSVIFLAFLILPANDSIAQSFGDWLVNSKAGEFQYAATVNDSGALFGQYCFPGNDRCMWLLGMSARCERGDEYPVLANSDAGATPIGIHCEGRLDDGLYRYIFTDFDSVDALVRKGSIIGFAVPLFQDQFKVVRFKLNGAIPAITAMRSAIERRTFRTNTRDQMF
jgi:hypothetical protein